MVWRDEAHLKIVGPTVFFDISGLVDGSIVEQKVVFPLHFGPELLEELQEVLSLKTTVLDHV